MREVKTSSKTIVENNRVIEFDGFVVTMTNNSNLTIVDAAGRNEWYAHLVTQEEFDLFKKISPFLGNVPRYYPNELSTAFRERQNKKCSPTEIFDILMEETATRNVFVVFLSGYDHSIYVPHTGKRYKVHMFDYIGGGLVNDEYNLRACFGHLRKLEAEDPNIYVPTAEMQLIPSYNRGGGRTHFIAFNWMVELDKDSKGTDLCGVRDSKYAAIEKLGFNTFKEGEG